MNSAATLSCRTYWVVRIEWEDQLRLAWHWPPIDRGWMKFPTLDRVEDNLIQLVPYATDKAFTQYDSRGIELHIYHYPRFGSGEKRSISHRRARREDRKRWFSVF